MNGSRNESTARKMARGKTQTAAERRACMKSHRKFIWFGKIRCSSTVNSPSVPKRLPKMHFFFEKPSFMTVLGEPLGDLGESTVRNRPCGKWPGKKSNFSSECSVFQENGPWEHRFCLRVASFWNFQQQKRLRVASF